MKDLEQVMARNRHLSASEIATKIEDHLGLRRQYDIRDSLSRPGISITTREQKPFRRWISDWEELPD